MSDPIVEEVRRIREEHAARRFEDNSLMDPNREVKARMDLMADRFIAALWAWDSIEEARYGELNRRLSGIAHRLQVVDDRVAELERKR